MEDEGAFTIARLLHSADEDVIVEALKSQDSYYRWVFSYIYHMAKSGKLEKGRSLVLRYSELIAQLGFKLSGKAFFAIGGAWLYHFLKEETIDLSEAAVQASLDIILPLGFDVNARYEDGTQIVHYLLCAPSEANPRTVCTLATVLLENGADPCRLDDAGRSSFDFAETCSWTAQWYEALGNAGYDCKEVERHTGWLQWCHFIPSHAFVKTTGTDEQDLRKSSRAGLIRRRGVPRKGLDDE